MAQRPTNDFDIDPNITSGTDLSGILNRFQDAVDSGNSGASRPAYLAAGGMWVKEGSPMRLYFYDGTKDIELYNTTDGIVGAIPDGRFEGQITTWDSASGEWTPDNAVVVMDDLVGIGGAPVAAPPFTAKEQLAEWKASFDARIKAEPNADKKAVTLEITEGEFDTFPSEKDLEKWLETRAAGDRLQVFGSASAGRFNFSNGYIGTGQIGSGYGSAFGSQNAFVMLNNPGTFFIPSVDAQISLGSANQNFKDAYFSGEVHADEFLRNGVPVPTAKDLIETLSTLREATRDETTLEGLRDALSDAIGGLIQKFEAQISTTES